MEPDTKTASILARSSNDKRWMPQGHGSFTPEERERIASLVGQGKIEAAKALETYKWNVNSKKRAVEIAAKYISGAIVNAISSGSKGYTWSFKTMKEDIFSVGPKTYDGFEDFVLGYLVSFFVPHYEVTILAESKSLFFDLAPFYESPPSHQSGFFLGVDCYYSN